MADLTDRLNELMAEMHWDRADLLRVSKQSSSVVSQWLGKGNKTIHKIGKLEAAIYLERATGFNALWIAEGRLPKRVSTGWPFRFDRQRFDDLDDVERGMVEHAARAELEQIETSKSGKQNGTDG